MHEDIIATAIAAVNSGTGTEWRQDYCQCDPSVGMVPCQYCAIWDCIKLAKRLVASSTLGDANE